MSCICTESSVLLWASSHIISVIDESLLLNQLARYFQRMMLSWPRNFLHIFSPQFHHSPSLKPSISRIFHTFKRSLTDDAKSRKTGEQLFDSWLGHFHLFSKLSRVALGIIQPNIIYWIVGWIIPMGVNSLWREVGHPPPSCATFIRMRLHFHSPCMSSCCAEVSIPYPEVHTKDRSRGRGL